MIKTTKLAAQAAAIVLLLGCGQEQPASSPATPPELMADAAAPAAQPEPHVVEYRAVGKTFEGPAEIPSGWTTFRFVNASSMLHFAMIDVPPAEASMAELNDLMLYFQEAMDGMNAGDEAAVNAAFGKFPAWVGELGRNGGPGFLSPGRIGQTTVFLEPGRYLLECYIKSDGIFHTTPPGEGQQGMVLEFTVTDENHGAPEPEANLVLAARNSGFEITAGALRAGVNTIRVNFEEQQALPSFVGHDVHLMVVESEASIPLVDGWMDWRTPNGLEDPIPVSFLGGVNDMPAGSHGYFTVDLQPGEYAFVAEVPGPQAAGFVLPVSVAGPGGTVDVD
jgi:hypothetical protein